ncbi:hypothetical protein AB0J38_44630 [Streptomyces sp. NPDC050095]|uniref:hypothetical protein n=1 Tax=unclassified Streptomyces TaxID=2593676 RepID=UPI003430B790
MAARAARPHRRLLPWRSTTGVALAVAAVLAAPGSAHPATPLGAEVPDGGDWGTVLADGGPLQADAWVARVRGLGGVADTALFETHHPATAKAPHEQGGGDRLADLAPDGFGIGAGSLLFSRALGDARPASPASEQTVKAPGSAFAEAGGASVSVGLPYLANPTGGVQLSPIGVHVDGVTVSALASPGKPVAFSGGVTGGYFSLAGEPVVTVPKLWPTNFGVRLPADYTRQAIALAVTNEQVTTDTSGRPTRGADGGYKFDPKATSGYVNAVHVSLLGTQVADVTVGHAAVLRKA